MDLRAPEASNAASNTDPKTEATDKPTEATDKPTSEPSTDRDASAKYVPTTSLPDRSRHTESQSGTNEGALPDGWHERYDGSSGRVYYCNPRTMESQWEFPRLHARDDDSERDRNLWQAGLHAAAFADWAQKNKATGETVGSKRSVRTPRKEYRKTSPYSESHDSNRTIPLHDQPPHDRERRSNASTSELEPVERQSTPYASMAGEKTIVNDINHSTTSIPPLQKHTTPASQSSANEPPAAEDIFTQFFNGSGVFHGAHQTHQPGLKQTLKSSGGSDPTVTCGNCRGKGYRERYAKCARCKGSGKSRRMGDRGVCPVCYGFGDSNDIVGKKPCKECQGKGGWSSDYYRHGGRSSRKLEAGMEKTLSDLGLTGVFEALDRGRKDEER